MYQQDVTTIVWADLLYVTDDLVLAEQGVLELLDGGHATERGPARAAVAAVHPRDQRDVLLAELDGVEVLLRRQ